MSRPRLYLHPDRRYLSVGFDDTSDTLLKLPEGGWGDADRVERWVQAIDALLSDAGEAGSYDERHTCAHHGLVDCEACRERDLEARGT